MNEVMKVKKVDEAGYQAALLGLSYNKKQPIEDMLRVAGKLAFHDGGHNKFLESIIVWLEVTAPRYVWQEMDTYRISTKQSESTMHTLMKELTEAKASNENMKSFIENNFEPGSIVPEQTKVLLDAVEREDLLAVKRLNPEGFIQKRMWCMSYKTLRNIIIQRRHHRLPHWKMFIQQVLEQIEHPELLPSLESK